MNKSYHELRYIEASATNSIAFSLFDDVEERLTLLDFIMENDRVFLLGNPGVGKTTELKSLFKKLWDDRQTNQLVPIFVNIKNFSQESSFESLIDFDDWQQVPAVLFIFDGLDEISNIGDFIVNLQYFISRYAELRLKFIISCRTNIYQKYLIDIPEFITVYLKNLSHFQIESILKNKFEITASNDIIEHFSNILQTPFNLDLFANYHLKHGNFPKNIEESWELLLNQAIKSIAVNDADEAVIDTLLQEVAIANELMQQNVINKNQLEIITGTENIEIFFKIPFIIYQELTKSYNFIHKNYQEYYAAKYISALNDAEIIQFIKADELEQIRPNLFNTTTFLLNILKDEKLDLLKDWVFKNNVEVLFFADENSFSEELKNEIFEKYFKEVCIEKSYWISNNGKIAVDTLSKFANLDFLITQITNTELHLRGRGSALEILAQKVLTKQQADRVKELLISLLYENNDPITAEILRSIKYQNFHKDQNFFNKVLDLVHDSSNKDICHQLISIMAEIDDNERNSELFIAIIKRYYSSDDNVIRGTEYHIAHTVLNTEDLNLNLELLELLFGERYLLRSKTIFFDNFEAKLKERTKALSSDSYYLEKFAEIAFGGQHRMMSNPLLANIISEIGLTPTLTLHILQKENMSRDVLYNISGYLNQECIDAIVEGYKNGSLTFQSPDDIESLRNWLSNYNLSLALYLEEQFKKENFKFTKDLISEEQIDAKRKEYNDFSLRNFKLLFDKDGIVTEITEYFKRNGINSLTKSEFQPLFFKWYDELNYHGIQYVVHTVFETAFRLFPQINIDITKVNELLNDSYFYLSVIRSGISHSSSKIHCLEVEDIILITLLTRDLTKKLDFNNVIKINPIDSNRFTTTVNFSFLKLLLFFDIEYNITQDKEFYLNTLSYGYAGESSKSAEESFIAHAKNIILDEVAINKKVIENINEGNLNFFSKEDHISYGIDHNLTESFDKIAEMILEDETLFNQKDILVNFVDKIPESNRLKFLKDCCTEPKSYFYWSVIKLIKERKMDDQFILKAATQYLELGDFNFIDDALNILFFLNQQNALYYYDKVLRQIILNRPDSSGLFPKDVLNYKQMNELDLLEGLFNLIYQPSTFKSFYLYQSRNFMSALIGNLSSNNEGYEKIKDILSQIRKNLNKIENPEEVAHKIFYINDLSDISYNSLLKSKSTKFSFEDVRRILGK